MLDLPEWAEVIFLYYFDESGIKNKFGLPAEVAVAIVRAYLADSIFYLVYDLKVRCVSEADVIRALMVLLVF